MEDFIFKITENINNKNLRTNIRTFFVILYLLGFTLLFGCLAVSFLYFIVYPIIINVNPIVIVFCITFIFVIINMWIFIKEGIIVDEENYEARKCKEEVRSLTKEDE